MGYLGTRAGLRKDASAQAENHDPQQLPRDAPSSDLSDIKEGKLTSHALDARCLRKLTC